MNELQIFNYDNHTIRTVQKDNETWWVAKDVCDVFGETNRNRAMQSLEEDEKGYTQMTTPGGIQNIAIINEPGLYSLLFAMQPSKAKARGVSEEYIAERENKLRSFKRWVTHDVLPAIRKHGIYATDKVIDNILNDPDFGIRLLKELKSEREKVKQLETENATQRQLLAEAQPKATYYDLVLQTNDVVSASQIAKDYGWSATRLNRELARLGVQFKQGGVWLLYQKYADKGYTKSKTHTYVDNHGVSHSALHTYWTQQGRLFIYHLLKREGWIPACEKEQETYE